MFEQLKVDYILSDDIQSWLAKANICFEDILKLLAGLYSIPLTAGFSFGRFSALR